MRPQTETKDGRWVDAKPLPFYFGILSKGYWLNFKKLLGRAIRGEDHEFGES